MKQSHHNLGPKISTNVRLYIPDDASNRIADHPENTVPVEPRPSPPSATQRLRVRPVSRHDKDRIAAFFRQLSPQARYERFLRPVGRLSNAELAWLISTDPERHWGWVAERESDASIVGFGQAIRSGADNTAEIAAAVLDRWQGRGLGAALLALAARDALNSGVQWLHGFTFQDNRRILTYADHRHAIITPQGDGTLRLDLTAQHLLRDLPPQRQNGEEEEENLPWQPTLSRNHRQEAPR